MNNNGFIKLLWATQVVIFLVILAGSVVRMTGSGMGCPDWPKCFGYIIPPSEASQVEFQPNFNYNKGQMILVNDELLRATSAFKSTEQYNSDNWEVYEKHDYAIFNPTHTWIEYINRLLGAISGLFMLAVFVFSIILLLTKKVKLPVVLLSFFGVILLGFQAWLGKTVVDSNLAGAKITAHLFGALALVAVILIIIRIVKGNQFMTVHTSLKPWIWVSFILLMVQIFFGTEVRHLVDEIGNESLKSVFSSAYFLIHRSFSWLVFLSSLFLLNKARIIGQFSTPMVLLGIFLIVELFLGLSLYFLELPKLAQPLHLLFANLLFATFIWLLLAKTQ